MERVLSIDELLAHTSWVRDLARTLVVDPATAEDLAQETLLVALSRPPRADVPVRAWLAGVLRHLSASWRRREARRSARESLVEPAQAAESTEELASQVELERQLAQQVLALDEPFRRTVLLRYFRGLSSAEIARRTGTPEGTVRWRLKRGLDRLRASMDEEYGERRTWVLALLPTLKAHSVEVEVTGASTVAAGWIAVAADLLRVLALPLAGLLAVIVSALALGLFATSERAPATFAFGPSAADSSTEVARTDPFLDPIESAERARLALGEAPPSEALSTFELRARALDADGEPLANARLELTGASDVAATSGADGELVLNAPFADFADDATVAFVLSAPGCVPRAFSARLRGASVLWLGDLALAPAAVLEGRVLDASGAPATGAEVLVESLPEASELRERSFVMRSYLGSQLGDDAPRARTGADGRYRFDALPAGFVRVWARADYGFAGASERLALCGGSRASCPEVALPPLLDAEVIEGRVVDPDGMPVEGARVEGIRSDLAERVFRGDPLAFHAKSDAHGRFRLAVNPRPELAVFARDAEGRYADARAELARGGRSGLELALRPRRFVELRAEDAEGRAVASFELSLVRAADGVRTEGPLASDARDGALRFEPPDAPFVLLVQSRGFETLELGPFARDGAPDRIECELADAHALRGRVLHEGEPVAGARVVAAPPLSAGCAWRAVPGLALGPQPFGRVLGAPEAEGVSDAAGEFELRGVPAVRSWLVVEAPGFGASLHGPFETRALAESGAFAIELETCGALDGRVLAASGRSPAGVLVGATNGDGRLRVARSDGDGRFRFDELAPGAWQVRQLARDPSRFEEERALFAEGEARAGSPPHEVVVAPGAVVGYALDLRPASRAWIRGELLFDGRSPGPWRVELVRADAKERAELLATALDVTGRFELELPAAGTYSLRAFDADRTGLIACIEDRVEVEEGGTEWKLALDTGLVALRAAPGEEVPGGRLTYAWEGPGALRYEARVDRDGRGGGLALRAPAGRGRFVAKPSEKAEREDRSILEVELEAGTTLAPVLPPVAIWSP